MPLSIREITCMKACYTNISFAAAAALILVLPGCSSVKVWPFGESGPAGTPRTPANATEYQCNAGKHFYVRPLDNGNAIWLIYPDREVSLNKATDSAGIKYTNGVAVLDLSGNEATLTDGATISYSGCKTSVKK